MRCSCVKGRGWTPVPGGPVPKRICRAVFHRLHEEIRQDLNFHAIYPLLRRKELLLASEDHTLLSNPQISREKKVDIMISWLPRCKKSDYLTPFVECLRESEPTAGEGHTELAQKLEEMRDLEYQRFTIVVTKKSLCCLLLSLWAVLTLVSVLSVLLFQLLLPHIHHVEASQHKILGSATMPLDMYIDKWWLRSLGIAFSSDSSCSGQVGVVMGRGCSELPVLEDHVGFVDQPCQTYMLPGSSLEVYLPNNASSSSSSVNSPGPLPHVWLTRSLESYFKLLDQLRGKVHPYQCGKTYSDASCYSAQGNSESSVIFNISRADYYCLIFTNSDDSSTISPIQYGIEWSYTNITYDFLTISSHPKDYPLLAPWAVVRGTTPVSVQVSESFKFGNESCALLHFGCGANDGFSEFSISHLVERWDIPVLISVIYIAISAILLGILVPVMICM